MFAGGLAATSCRRGGRRGRFRAWRWAGIAGGVAANEAASGLPAYMLVGVSESAVYGFEGKMKKAGEFVFQVPREGLEAKVHQRVNVKVLELIEPGGSRIELEGNRLPLTHSKNVMDELAG